MRILLLCNKSPWPPKDGGAAATLLMIKGLSECKASVTVLALNTRKHFTDTAEIPPEYKTDGGFHFVKINTSINPFKLLINLIASENPYNIERFKSSEYKERLSSLLKNHFDIIQVEGLSLCQYLPLIRSETKAKVVFRPHNIENKIWSQLADEEKNPFRKSYFMVLSKRIKKAEKEIINQFDGVAAIAPNDLAWFKSNGLSKPSILSKPGVLTQNLKAASDIKPMTVLFIGALDWLPNINGLRWYVNEVWPMVLKAVPGAVFSIAGRNASWNTRRLLKGNNIIYCGEVPSSSGFMNNKSIMIVPLFSGSGIRVKIIEGMSLGKCIVSTSFGAEGIDYVDRQNIFIADTPDDFADCVIELLRNDDLLKQTGQNAIENVRKNYDILASAENLLKFYSSLTA